MVIRDFVIGDGSRAASMHVVRRPGTSGKSPGLTGCGRQRRDRTLLDAHENVACGTFLERWSPCLTVAFQRQDPIDVGLTEEVLVHRSMLSAMRAQRGRFLLAPARHVEGKVDSWLRRQVGAPR